MVIGDAHNDLLAMREVGWPVAMGNAVPELRALARVVVADVEHHGVAEALALACASV
jgi:hydroxymethylpyrimidine pyrophosphatase-like HAD family hydrolase